MVLISLKYNSSVFMNGIDKNNYTYLLKKKEVNK